MLTIEEVSKMIFEQQFANLGFMDNNNIPSIRRVFCTWHQGIGRHLISTNTSSLHVQELLKKPQASLYFADSETFEGVCLSGEVKVHFEHEYKAMLWHEGDEKYYPNGVDDDDYCIIEFVASEGRFYRYDGIGNITLNEIMQFDKDVVMLDYSR